MAGDSVQYLNLTPEDGDFAFFCYRLFQEWPDLRARYEDLFQELPALSRGALLGRAIAETRPDFRLLLDDFHLVETSPIEPELLAMFRHFPTTGTLVVASRYQLPAIQRDRVEVWGADDSLWRESPQAADLLALPEALLAKALAIHLVGQATPSEPGWELVRRNIAELSTDTTLRLRPCWKEAARLALLHAPPGLLWEEIEQGMRAIQQQWFRTTHEKEIRSVLERLPSEMRRRNPYFLQMEGDLSLESGRVEAARECYSQAIALTGDNVERILDLKIRQTKLAIHAQDTPALQGLSAELRAMEEWAPPLQRAQILNVTGAVHLLHDQFGAAEETLQRVLAIPTCGDRMLEFEHFEALSRLHAIHFNLRQSAEAMRYGKQSILLASSKGFQLDLLDAYNTVNDSLQLDEYHPPSLRKLIDIPNDAFIAPSMSSLCGFVYGLATYLHMIGEYDLSLNAMHFNKELAQSYNINRHVIISNIGILGIYGAFGKVEEARPIYHELNQLPLSKAQEDFLRPIWGLALSNAGRFQEAEEVLQACMADSLSDHARMKARLYWLQHRHEMGDTDALAEIRMLLETPLGDTPWNADARLFREIGLCSLPSTYRIHAFGALAFLRDSTELRWPRRKILTLFGLLVLNAEGLSSERLAQELFGDPEALEALHRAAYNLRQALKAGGTEEFLESAGGTYRLKVERIAFCDLHDFDALFEKARSLEAQDIKLGAALFYRLALILASAGPLFENLPDEFDEARAHYRTRMRAARDYLEKHGAALDYRSLLPSAGSDQDGPVR